MPGTPLVLVALMVLAPASEARHSASVARKTAPHGAQFQKSLAKTLKKEGGYVNAFHDRGGETYRGITRVFHPDWPGWATVDSVKHALGHDSTLGCSGDVRAEIDRSLLRIAPLNRSIEIFYRREFWIPLRLDREKSQARADSIFNLAVRKGLRAVQQARAKRRS